MDRQVNKKRRRKGDKNTKGKRERTDKIIWHVISNMSFASNNILRAFKLPP
jgi:hypothetical protein